MLQMKNNIKNFIGLNFSSLGSFSLLNVDSSQTCLFINCTVYNTCIMGLPLSCLCSSPFSKQHKMLICDSVLWLLTGSVMIFSEETWIHCIALSNVELLHLVEGRQRRKYHVKTSLIFPLQQFGDIC